MGCHTWFKNKISDMPQDHLVRLREETARSCRNAWIVKTSYDRWLNETKRDLDNFEKSHKKGEKLSKDDKSYLGMLKKMSTRKYYDDKRNEYLGDAEALENPKTPRNKVLRVLAKHNFLFDGDLRNGYYDLGQFGWGDNYRVYGYPAGRFINAEEAISFLETYDNGHNVVYNMREGMCDEIREIINRFFVEFPNGYIDYG